MYRLKKTYQDKVLPELSKELGIKNRMALPKITKMVVNVGIGDATKDKGIIESVKKDIAAITGQTPAVRQAKVSVASFGVRRGMPVGLVATIRGDRIYAFLDRLISIVLPRLRDFRGLSTKSFDKHGNYTLGIEEHTVFPEIDMSKSQPRGLEITIVTSTKDTKKAKRLLELMGLPFAKEE